MRQYAAKMRFTLIPGNPEYVECWIAVPGEDVLDASQICQAFIDGYELSGCKAYCSGILEHLDAPAAVLTYTEVKNFLEYHRGKVSTAGEANE